MTELLIGNGFDLHHKFPTRYIDFLQTVQFLIENYDESFSTVGHVFGNKTLQKQNTFIRECYDVHNHIYDSTQLAKEVVTEMTSNAKDNMWFNYLCKCVSKNINWIDFEKEIIRVLGAFDSFFNEDGGFTLINDRVSFDLNRFPPNQEDRYIVSLFDFFCNASKNDHAVRSRLMFLKDKYVLEEVSGSGFYRLAEEEIASELYKSLRVLANLLRDYLHYFVDVPAQEYANLGLKPHFASLPTPNRVYSFNYTNTIETLYNSMVDHIHGNTCTEIVLGINPDENDLLGNVDTTFLQFKKYFQRVFFKTDNSFLRKMSTVRRMPRSNDRRLYVIGHSLDSTDEDIIKQIFSTAQSIWILYHSETSVKNQIKNLVQIYGKEGFDQLREEKDLQFLPQSGIQWRSDENASS